MDPKLLRMYSDILNEQDFPTQYALRNTEDPRIAAARKQATASTPTPGTAAAVRGARGGAGTVVPPGTPKPLPGDPNAPAYQKDPGQTKKVGTGASNFPTQKPPQGGRPIPTPADSMAARGKVDAMKGSQASDTQTTTTLGGPAGVMKTSAAAPAAPPPAAPAQQATGGTSTPSSGGMPNTTPFGGKPTATAASNPFAMKVGGGDTTAAAPAAAPAAPAAAPAGPMSTATMPATAASPGGPSATTVGGKENTVSTTSGTLKSGDGSAVTSGAGKTFDRFGTPQFEEGLEEETDEFLEEELEEAFNEMLRLSGIQLNEKAVSKQQQKFMGMVHAMQKGEKVKGASPELKKVAKSMGKKDAKDFASTKHKGLPQKVSESVVLEAGSNLEHIVTRFKHETKRFLAGDDLDNDLYEALYDYYADAGEMPYGVAKARDGDPYQWVSDHFADELALMGYDRQFQETVIPVVDNQLSELARLAGLSESRVDECGDMGMDQRDSMNVSTNMSSDGTKSVTISAQGDQAEALVQMLKLAGMGHMGHSHDDKPVMVVSKDDEEMMDEEYKNSPDEEYHSIGSIIHQGTDLNREKRQYADQPKLGDNPMAEEVALDEELESLLDSVLMKEGDPQRPRDDTGVADIFTADKGIAPPSPDEGPIGKNVKPMKTPQAPSSPAMPRPGGKK